MTGDHDDDHPELALDDADARLIAELREAGPAAAGEPDWGALSAGIDMTAGSFYAGVWASNVDFGDDTDLEVDLYGGYRTEWAGFAWDFGVVGYVYGNAPSGVNYDYVEFKVAASRAIGPVTAGAAVDVSPNFFGVDGEAT